MGPGINTYSTNTMKMESVVEFDDEVREIVISAVDRFTDVNRADQENVCPDVAKVKKNRVRFMRVRETSFSNGKRFTGMELMDEDMNQLSLAEMPVCEKDNF